MSKHPLRNSNDLNAPTLLISNQNDFLSENPHF